MFGQGPSPSHYKATVEFKIHRKPHQLPGHRWAGCGWVGNGKQDVQVAASHTHWKKESRFWNLTSQCLRLPRCVNLSKSLSVRWELSLQSHFPLCVLYDHTLKHQSAKHVTETWLLNSTVFCLFLFCHFFFLILSAERICLLSFQVSTGLIFEAMVPSSVKLSSFSPHGLTHSYTAVWLRQAVLI